jgi:hypothetical protein
MSRDRLAELLSEGEVETLHHLAREGMGANTIRAITSDLASLEVWSLRKRRGQPARRQARQRARPAAAAPRLARRVTRYFAP